MSNYFFLLIVLIHLFIWWKPGIVCGAGDMGLNKTEIIPAFDIAFLLMGAGNKQVNKQ